MGATVGGLSRNALLPNLSSSAGKTATPDRNQAAQTRWSMRCSSLVLRPGPRCEIVERDAQSRGNLGERGGEGVAAEAAMGAPSADRVLAGAEASDQLDRQ